MSKNKKNIKVHTAVMIPADLLYEHPNNTQKQSKHEFAELRKSIAENGFDETLLVYPRDDGEAGYWVIAGNHRKRAGVAEGMDEFPCVVRNDWTNVRARIESVRRNFVRGQIDKQAFSEEVDLLSMEASLPKATIFEQMGFENDDAINALYQQEKEEAKQVEKLAKEAASSDGGIIKLMDDIGYVVSNILAKHGHNVPHSFIVFPTGGKNHMYIAANPSLKKSLEAIATMCSSQNLDINVALAGIIAVGLDETGFVEGDGRDKIIARVDEDDDGFSDLDLL